MHNKATMTTARTEKQREAARRNGAKSRGPATAAGKQKSARNSHRHGLYAKKLTPAPGSPEESALIAIAESLKSQFQPRNAAESRAIEIAAISFWAFRRIQALEKITLQIEMEAQRQLYPGETFISLYERAFRRLSDETNTLVAVMRLEDRHHRKFRAAIQHFHQLRALIARSEPTENENEKCETNPGTVAKPCFLSTGPAVEPGNLTSETRPEPEHSTLSDQIGPRAESTRHRCGAPWLIAREPAPKSSPGLQRVELHLFRSQTRNPNANYLSALNSLHHRQTLRHVRQKVCKPIRFRPHDGDSECSNRQILRVLEILVHRHRSFNRVRLRPAKAKYRFSCPQTRLQESCKLVNR
jgi:hypothetical protein